MKLIYGLMILLSTSLVLATTQDLFQRRTSSRRTSNRRTLTNNLQRPSPQTQQANQEPQGDVSPLPRSRVTSIGERSHELNERKRARTDYSGIDVSSRPRSRIQSSPSSSPRHEARRSQSEMADSEGTATSSSSDSPSVSMLTLSTDQGRGRHHLRQHPSASARANIRLFGPGVTVVGGAQSYPEYSNIRKDETTSHQLLDPQRAKAAGTTYEHEGGAVVSAKGNVVKATVDARRSSQGGRISSSGFGRAPIEFEVSPGSVTSLRHGYSQTGGQIVKIKGELYGKGSVKASAEYIPREMPSPHSSQS